MFTFGTGPFTLAAYGMTHGPFGHMNTFDIYSWPWAFQIQWFCNFTGPLTHGVFHDDSNLYIFIHASIASAQIFFSDCFYLGSEFCTDIWNFDHLFFDISTCRFRFEIMDNPFFVQHSFFQLGIDFQLETF